MKPSDPSDQLRPEFHNITSTLDNDAAAEAAGTTTTTYYCNYCNRMLYHKEQDESTGKHVWTCVKCGFYPENQLVRQASRLEAPEGPNKELLTATPSQSAKASQSQYVDKQQNLSPLFKALEQRGFRFTHYEEH